MTSAGRGWCNPFASPFGKRNLLDRRWFNGALLFLSILCTKGCKKGSDTDPCGTKVVYLINLQAGVNLAAAIQNFINLIGGDRIKSAAKGVQLDQIQIITGFHKVCCCIQSGVVHPLVIDTDRALNRYQMGNRILSEDCHTIAVDQIRDTVMNLGSIW